MQTATRRRTTWAIAASALAHIAVLIAAILYRATLPLPADGLAGPPEPIIPILLLPHTLPGSAAGAPQPSAVRLHRRPQRPDDSAPPIAPLPAAVATRPSERPPTTTGEGQASSTPAAALPGPDLRLALRHGLAGCANAGASLTRAERERCNEQLGQGVASAPYLPAAIEPRIRAYYDAVAEAKKPDPPPVPLKAPGSLKPFEGDPRTTNGHGPGIGCKIPFGPGEKPKKLPHALYLGPCFIEPPKGSLTPEVDITPP
jgi:hypothetical protein